MQSSITSNRFYPISHYQEYMVDMALKTAPTSFINQEKVIRWAFRIRPGFSPRRLSRAFDQLVQRHESLRLRFIKSGDTWLSEVLAQHPTGLLIEDLTHLSKAEQDAAINTHAKEPMTALSPALFEMHLLRCGPAGDVVLTRLSHAVGDGYSNAILIEDLLKYLLMMPPKSRAKGQAEFIRHREQGLMQDAKEKELFWQQRVLPLPEEARIGRNLKGLEKHSYQTVGKTIRLDGVLSDAQSEQLDAMAKSSGVSAYSYLHAAFCEAICSIAGADQIMVKSPLSRHNTDTAEFIGADVQAVVVKYTSGKAGLATRAAWVAAEISQGIAHLPSAAFDDGGEIDIAVKQSGISLSRFLVHVEVATGRLKASPFKSLFDKGMRGKLSLGPVSLEPVSLPTEVETNYELVLLVDQTANTPTAALIANAEGYEHSDLERIAALIQSQFENCGV